MYLRSERFSDCLQVLIDAGAKFNDKVLLSVLLGNSKQLKIYLIEVPAIVNKLYTFPHAFTSVKNVSLLHICAEYNKVKCAKVLLENGADVNAKSPINMQGMGGHTPIFHTVNSHNNYAFPMLKFLLDNNPSIGISLKGLVWGQGCEWETFIPETNPINYAMMGILRQFQGNPEEIKKNIQLIQKYKYGKSILIKNVPNVYLVKSRQKQKERILRELSWSITKIYQFQLSNFTKIRVNDLFYMGKVNQNILPFTPSLSTSISPS